jgi:hypothetical protein
MRFPDKIISLLILTVLPYAVPAQHYQTTSGEVSFVSEAPLEIISAKSNKLRGVIDPQKNTFAFSVTVISFEGFNSPLQREHFNENYMETGRFPEASFRGKIIEDVDLMSPGTYEVRSKGQLSIHGVQREVIVRSTISVVGRNTHVKAELDVVLEDHDIKVPKIVNQKIASVIRVTVDADLVHISN